MNDKKNRRIIEYELQDGTTIMIEGDGDLVSDVPGPTIQAGGEKKPLRTVVKAQETFDKTVQSLEPTIGVIRSLITSVSAYEAEVTFGVKLAGKTSIIIAGGEIEANFVVKLKWKGHEDSSTGTENTNNQQINDNMVES
jgi:hypothetical protein